jgi:enterochelin esterase-like enzyme
MILVMPGGGALSNAAEFRRMRSYEDLIALELLPEVEKNFCTWNTRETRAIGGISRGGFWALSIVLRQPETFGAVGGHSPALYVDNAPPTHNPLLLAQSAEFPPGAQPRFWVDVGIEDPARTTIEEFAERLRARDIDPGLTINPTGGHTIEYWAAHVTEYLAFYGQLWPRQIEDLPSCLD